MDFILRIRNLLNLRYLSGLNRRKILSGNMFALLFATLTALSFYNLSSVMGGYLNEGRYEIFDGTEYRLIHAKEALTGGRVGEVAERYGELDLPADVGRVAVADLRVARMAARVYGWDFAALAASGEISDERFYADRAAAMAAPEAGGTAADASALAKTAGGAFGPQRPIVLGYAEGWRNINAGMRNCVRLVCFIVFLVLVPVFNEDRTLGVENLIRSTKSGRENLDRVRVVNALELSALIYASAVVLYVTPLAIVYGLEGASLPIQGDPAYFLSSAELSFLGQFAVNLLIGAVAVLGMAALALLVSSVISDLFTGCAALFFIAALSYLIDMLDLSGFKRFLWNFSPMGMTDFGMYYAGHETYFGLPSVVFIPTVSAVMAALLFPAALAAKGRNRQFFVRGPESKKINTLF
jgi:hypothetical protein